MPLTIFDECGEQLLVTVEIALPSAAGPSQLWDSAEWDGGSWIPAPGDTPAGIWDLALWDSSLWAADDTWVDVSAWLRSVVVDTSFDEDMREWKAGTASAVLNNRDGRFSPDNIDDSAPYVVDGVSSIDAGRLMRVTVASTSTPAGRVIFHGKITSWGESWPWHTPRDGDALTTVAAVDVWGSLANINGHAGVPVGAGDTLVDRVVRILTAASCAAPVDSDIGLVAFQATDLGSDPISELNLTSQSEGGQVWVAADTIVARDRYSLIEDDRQVNVQYMFGDGGGSEIPWETIDVAPVDVRTVVNTARYKRVGGAEQSAIDQVSVAKYGIREDKSSNIDKLICSTDAEVLELAEWAVLTQARTRANVRQLAFKPGCDRARAVPMLMGLQLRDLTEVVIRPPSAQSHVMRRSCFVSGLRYEISAGDVTLTVSTVGADAYRTYATSRWDVGHWDESMWFY